MNQALSKQRFPLGLVLFSLGLAVYKAAMLVVSIGADWKILTQLVGLDLFYLSLLFLLAILLGFIKNRLLSVALWLALVFMSAVYLVDSFVLLALDDHADLFDIGRYAPEAGVVLSFFGAAAYIAIALFLLSLFLSVVFTTRMKKLCVALLVLTLLGGIVIDAYVVEPLARYAMLRPGSLMESVGPQPVVAAYSKDEITFYTDLKSERAEIPAPRPNIILVVVESLSSINSNKTSGVGHLLGGFDELAEEGLLFRNFFANHQASEGGLIALLGGYPPIHFPTATAYMFDEFAIQASVIGEYQQQGYFTEFLTNSDLSFIGLDNYLNGLGLNRSRGRDELDDLRTARRVVQDAPPDDLLYQKAFSTFRMLSGTHVPFLMVLATTSTHLPYSHPTGGADTAEAVWEWSLQQLTDFHRKLEKADYFKDGILLITGDHRQMRPLTRKETERYGDSARARVPLLVIGKDYHRGEIDDRFFQQSDLLRMLGRISQSGASLSPHPIWVERYNRKYGRVELIDDLRIFDQSDSGRKEYRLKMPGNRIEWQGGKPDFAREIETRIHAQRSQHQGQRQ